MHQIEAVLNWVDGRDRTPPEQWSELLFWGKFVGSDRSLKIVRPGCGWAHYPPNGIGRLRLGEQAICGDGHRGLAAGRYGAKQL